MRECLLQGKSLQCKNTDKLGLAADDWQKAYLARAKMRMIIKQCMKKYKYSPKGMNNDIQTIIIQQEF